VEIAYDDGPQEHRTTRRIRPLRLESHGDTWYLLGYCLLRQAERLALAGRQVVARRGWRVLCAQALPERVSTDPAHITGDTASVTVRLHFGGSERHIIARVIRDPAVDIWYIDDLACGH